jgi:hypothetical protein
MSTHDGTATFEPMTGASTGASTDTDTTLDRQLVALQNEEFMITRQLEGVPHALQVVENISLYNDWRRLRKLELKSVRRRKNEVLRLLAIQRKAQRQQAQESATLQHSPHWHFVELARKQMRPEEFAKAWDYAERAAKAVQP